MNESILPQDDDPLLNNLDLGQIFIGREQELAQYRFYLEHWKQQLETPGDVLSQPEIPPSPNQRIQGLVGLLYGESGFGKSTLLKHYREMALEYDQEFNAGRIIDWEFAAQGKRGFLNPAPGEV